MAFHLFHINEVYSNASGTVQYVEFVGDADGQNIFSGHALTATDGVTTETFPIVTNLPDSSTNGKSVLFATQGYADLGLATPNYIIPDGFLFLGDGTVEIRDMVGTGAEANAGRLIYDDYLGGGIMALNREGVLVSNSPLNYTGDNGTIPGNPIVGDSAANGIIGTSAKDFIVGLGANDIINGGAGNDTIRGGAGADILDGGGGTDRIQGDADNDKMMWGRGDFFDGGANTDTLKVGVATLDLTTAANSNNKLLNIEQIDLRLGAHTLTLNRSDVLAMSPTDQVKILGDGGDTVNFVGAQIEGGSAPSGFTRYTINGAVLIVDSDINVI